MKLLKITHIFLFALLLSSCSDMAVRPDRMRQPELRVGLVQGQESVRLMVSGVFNIYNPKGRFIARGLEGHRWQASIVELKPARVEYRLRYWLTSDHRLAYQKAQEMRHLGLNPEVIEIKPSGERWHLEGMNKKLYNVVLWDIFASKESAEKGRANLAHKAAFEVMEFVKEPAGGSIELTSTETSKSYRFPSGSRIVTERFAVIDMPVGEGYHWQGKKTQVFRGNLELLIDRQRRLSVVNVLPLETYLRGVVPSEMSGGFPPEALKAQAIVARSEVLAKAGRNHLDEGFDICATAHCQVYGGISKEDERTSAAVTETAGLVLKVGGEIADAVYSGVCGGHTENNDAIWDGAPQPHLRGIYDGPGKPDLLRGLLQRDDVVAKWVQAKPPVYCNTVSTPVSAALQYTRKYFRWQVKTSRADLEKSIRTATGRQFGQLLDIVPVQRGVSGRIRRLRIVGSRASFEIEKELAIRQALSDNTLYSSCFTVEKIGRGSAPEAFVLHGAGWGHGVGMCQTGAAMMAQQGSTFEQIIRHYYAGAELGKAY